MTVQRIISIQLSCNVSNPPLSYNASLSYNALFSYNIHNHYNLPKYGTIIMQAHLTKITGSGVMSGPGSDLDFFFFQKLDCGKPNLFR